jgi:hypothetical protein
MTIVPAFFLFPEQVVALRRYYAGETPHFSTGIHERITAGYGDLNFNGFWQYPLPQWFINLHGWDI